jgi:predicted site-specific integrase-resolvase
VVGLSEACAQLGIAKPTMYKYLKEGAFERYREEGIIPAFKYENSRVWKFDLDQLDLWQTRQRERGRS